ncbi:MAG: alpha-hydroxy-acid oxidizing protein [Bryobacteraceae bacterium]|nr:alpha-hydroxy-acid oxidizing protein [Bryobacteraceae bacterium]
MPFSPGRRRFLGYLAAGPLHSQDAALAPAQPKDAINVFDFEAAARKALPPAHFGYLATGVDGDKTLAANRAAFDLYHLRTRRLVYVSRVDTGVELFGEKWPAPLMLAPCGNQKAFHPLGELPVARAAAARKTQMALSTVANTSVEDAARAAGRPIWFQLYPADHWEITTRLLARAEAAGCPVVAVTVDLPAGRNAETELRMKRLDKRDCSSCHGARVPNSPGVDFYRRKPMFDGIDMTGRKLYAPAFTWNSVERMRKQTKMKIVLKGIVTAEDAALAVEHGADGLIVSNHGGRAEESGRGTLESLPEVMEAVRGRIPVLVDGGFRRGTDIFKAPALGARAVLIGRPYLWGLAAFGQAGVEAVIVMLGREFELAMKQCGTRSAAEITARHAVPARR